MRFNRVLISISSLLFLVIFMYSVNVGHSYEVAEPTKNEPTSLSNLPEKMAEFARFLQTLKKRMNKAEKANPQIGLIMKRSMLADITEKREEIEQVDTLIKQILISGSMSREDKVEMELHLYNIDTFRALTEAATVQIKDSLKDN